MKSDNRAVSRGERTGCHSDTYDIHNLDTNESSKVKK